MKNKYRIDRDTAIVYATFKGKLMEFYFDLEDLPMLINKDLTYSVNTGGYLYWVEWLDSGKRKCYTAHRDLLFDSVQKDFVVDHINRKRNDNRKSNLRIIPKELNNSFGYTSKHRDAKCYSKASNDWWEVRRSYNRKQVFFGSFKLEQDAAEFARIIKTIWG